MERQWTSSIWRGCSKNRPNSTPDPLVSRFSFLASFLDGLLSRRGEALLCAPSGRTTSRRKPDHRAITPFLRRQLAMDIKWGEDAMKDILAAYGDALPDGQLAKV